MAPATAQKNINLETLKHVAISFPTFCEQKQIVSEVDRLLSISKKAHEVSDKGLKRSKRLRQAI
ncbi:MAG: restriction endonuclease subunit S, partial [Bacteroidetes bacterium]|nr:restriction endonuclease subunit S [Bacteroidota bacterium]